MNAAGGIDVWNFKHAFLFNMLKGVTASLRVMAVGVSAYINPVHSEKEEWHLDGFFIAVSDLDSHPPNRYLIPHPLKPALPQPIKHFLKTPSLLRLPEHLVTAVSDGNAVPLCKWPPTPPWNIVRAVM